MYLSIPKSFFWSFFSRSSPDSQCQAATNRLSAGFASPRTSYDMWKTRVCHPKAERADELGLLALLLDTETHKDKRDPALTIFPLLPGRARVNREDTCRVLRPERGLRNPHKFTTQNSFADLQSHKWLLLTNSNSFSFIISLRNILHCRDSVSWNSIS